MAPTVSLLPGDNRESLRRLIDDGVRVHSCVTDPPYGLVSVVKRFGGKDAAPAKHGTDGAFARASRGFMGQTWDGTGIERDPEFWKLIYDILLPGGFVFAFSGSRTGHWQACAMETAGFVMHPMHGWVYGSGFPKAHDAAKAIDKMLGVASVPTGKPKPGHEGFVDRGMNSVQSFKGTMGAEGGFARPWMDNPEAVARYHMDTTPASPEAQAWDGWAYGTQSQKPALEPIYLGQKPFSEKTGAANILKHGVGAFNIDGCRVGTNPEVDDPRLSGNGSWATDKAAKNVYEGGYAGVEVSSSPLGRWPANLILDGSPEVAELFPVSSVTGKRSKQSRAAIVDGTNWLPNNHESTEYTDSGSAARFFHSFPPDPVIYQAKAVEGRTDLGRWPANLILDGSPEVVDLFPESKGQQGDVRGTEPSRTGGEGTNCYGEYGRVPAAARNDSGSAARFFHNFQPDPDPIIYQAKAGKADRAGGKHPTVKPIALMQYLIRHITPPGGTVLDPFAGSGTTGEAAKREGFDCILMEAEPNYVEFLNSRFQLQPHADDSRLVDTREEKEIMDWLLSQI